ncbi:hypothetical protein C1645_820941 [Glomus cerebriforme]|uniref:Sel1 domain protein repeat-containing protein n=1 Tax=Glomus cerebriforme TaxID=658196 RepID=A0A397T7N9_9GLOM|nr:hypothetical protein C1645_820941 [Glomus cerebriforme]
MTHFLNFLNIKDTKNIHETVSDENFLKVSIFSKEFYEKIINTDDFNTFEHTLIKWIMSIYENNKIIFEFMKNHEENEFLFSSIIGFFYQYGIGGYDFNKNKSLELYLLAINNEKSLNQKFTNLYYDIFQNNIIIGKYLLSLFYYKDIILDKSFFNKYLKFARIGDPKAQYQVGICYEYGQKTKTNYNEAFKWYSESANNGHAEGQYKLGVCYEKGIGTDKNYDKAFKWYSESANNECAEGQCNLGICYEKGIGTDKDYDKAFKWYNKSAINGYALGQCNLGVCYEKGFGTDKIHNKALIWYYKAANNGCVEGQFYLGVYNERIKNFKEAFKWYYKSASNGCAMGQYHLSYCYRSKIGTETNYSEALKWYKMATEFEKN